MRWEDDFRAYLKKLDEKKPVVLCGDLNVAHEEIDLKNPKTNHFNAGFTDQERGKFPNCWPRGSSTPSATFTRTEPARTAVELHRRARAAATRGGASTTSSSAQRLKERLVSATIHDQIMGSDHCPVELVLK